MVGFIYATTTSGTAAIVNVEEIVTVVEGRIGNSLRTQVTVNTRDGKRIEFEMTLAEFMAQLAEVPNR